MKTIFTFLLFLLYFTTFSQVKVGENPNTINSSAVLEAESTNKGFLPPRMTTIQRDAIVSPPAGLHIHNLDTGCDNLYNAVVGAWFEICGICTPSPTTANAGTDLPSATVNSTTLAANTPVNGTGAWSVVSGSGGSFGNASSPTTSFTGIVGNSYVLRWTITTACASSHDNVSITFMSQPQSIPNLWAWYDADDAATFSLSGNDVTQWNDKSGNSLHLSQSNSANRPERVNSAINGKSVVRFNGTSDFLQSPSLQFFTANNTAKTVLIVFKTNNNSGQKFLVNHPFTGSPCSSETEIGYDTGYSNGSGNYAVHAGCSNATRTPADVIINGAWNVATSQFKSAGSSPNQYAVYLNGTAMTMSSDGSGYFTAGNYPTHFASMQIGGRATQNNGYHNGDIAEILMYNRQLTVAELNQLHTYLSAKYGINIITIP